MSDVLRTPDPLALLEHRAWVRALARRLLSDENDVDDVEQDTWATALETRPDEPRALRPWLGIVASRLALQRIRNRKRRARREEVASGTQRVEHSPAEVLAQADAHGHVVQAVLALEEPYRTTVLLRYFEGLSVTEVSRQMAAPLETVHTRIRRAHERLRKALEGEHGQALALVLAPLGAAPMGRAVPGPSRTPVARAMSRTGLALPRAAVLTAGAIGIVAIGMLVLTSLAGRESHVSDAERAPIAAAPQDDSAPSANPEGELRASPARTPRPPRMGRAGAAQAAVVPAPPPAPLPAEGGWVAYDLGDRKPIPGLALRIRTSGGETTVTTDASGRLPVDPSTVLEVNAAEPTVWNFAKPKDAEVKTEPSLWFWRDQPIGGTVRSTDPTKPLVPTSLTFTWFASHSMIWPADEPGRGFTWMASHGFGRSERPVQVRVDAAGRLVGVAPAWRGAMLTAEAPGFAPTVVPLGWTGPGECVLTIDLRPSLRIVGRISDESGAPVIGQMVSFDTAIEAGSPDEAERLRAMRPRGGVGVAGGADHWTVTFIDSATTDVRGIFHFDANPIGAGVVSVWKPGRLVCRKDLGLLEKDAIGFEMSLVPSKVRVVFRNDDHPLASSSLL